MAHRRTEPSAGNIRWQNQEKRPRGIHKRLPPPIRRSPRLNEIRLHTEFKHQTTRSKPALPSPSASNTPSKEAPQSSHVLSKVNLSPERTQKSSPILRPEAIKQPGSTTGHESAHTFDRKRKRSHNTEDLALQTQEKRTRILSPHCATKNEEETTDIDSQNIIPIEHWRKTGTWPNRLFEPDPNMSQELIKKRSSSAISYSQSVKEGECPPAHTPAYEKQVLRPAGIIMDQQLGEAGISDDSNQLITTLVGVEYEPPKHSLFEENLFWEVLNGVRSRNEARVVRDISPLLIPSAEHLCMRGISELENLTEEIQADWTKCVPLAGPLPRPDIMVGFKSSAFTNDEIEKLKYNSAPERPTLFTEDLFFPFLIGEAKCGENGLNIADRQNARSASTAVNAILQLYQTVSWADKLHRKISVFSISHDHGTVKTYGHYALVKKENFTFHRHLIHSFDITAYGGKNRWTAYNFIRAVYDHFAPVYLKSIKEVIAQLHEPRSESFMSTDTAGGDSEFADSQEIATSAPASQGSGGFIKPALPPKKRRQNKDNEIAGLKAQIDLLLKQQAVNASSGNGSMLQQELKRQREEAKQREDQLREQSKQDREQSKQEENKLRGQIEKLMNMMEQRFT